MKFYLRKSIFGLLMIAAISGSAQTQNITGNNKITAERCKSGILHHQLMQTDPQYAARIQADEAKIQQIISSGGDRSGSTYVIPVVVHVLHLGESVGSGTNISDAQINSAISNMNACYSGTGSYPTNIDVQFQLAQRDPTCNATTGIIRVNASGFSNYGTNGITSANETTIKAISKWPNSEYYNIWIVSEIDNNGGGSGTQGYAYFPGASSSYDGAVILYNSFGYDPTGALGYNLKSYTNRNVTANHELGHAFNLYHTFEGDDGDSDGSVDQCPVNVTCTTDGDKCCDTEAHRRDDGDCGATGNSCTGQSLVNVVQNIMAYSSDVCQVQFTEDQKSRIRAAISGSRGSLLTSPALLPVTGSAPIVTKACSPQSTNLSNNAGMGVYGLTIGSTTYSSSGTVADGGFRNNWCSNFSLAPSTTYSITVTNGTLNNEKVRVFIDYNNDGDFEDSGETVYNDNTGGLTHTGSFITPASPVIGQALWIRVISDFVNFTINNSCFVPTYGQVEDFSVTFTGGCTAPAITGTTPGSRCGTGTVVLGATASAGTLNWYAASSGGTSLGTGTSFTTPSISATTTYYVDATNAGCTSARTAVIATVNTTPSVSSTTPGSRCGTGTVVLVAAASAGTLNWYAASSGGTSLGTGTSYTTPSISATTTYYVDATNAGCTSARTAVIATVNTTPSVSSTSPGSRCGTGTVVLDATASAGTLNWYAVSSGGTSLGTGISFTTPSISATTTYYVDATNSGCTSARTAVIATVNPGPSVSSTTPGSRCGTGTVVLGATASAGTLNWYAASSGGTSLSTGTLYTTPSISATTTYYVDATNGGCTSARTSVIATVNITPSVSSTTAGSRCGAGTVVLGAAASAGTLNWYAASSGGTSLGTGTSFTTPSISATTTYYVDATNGGCASARTSVIATVNTTPSVSSTTPGNRCGTGTVVLGATASAGTLNWYAASTGGTSLGTGTSFTTLGISTTTTYYVDATNGGCTSARTAVIATVNSLPSLTSTITESTCADNDGAIHLTVSGGAPSFTYNWSNGATTEDISGLSQGSYTVTVTDQNTCSAQHIKAVTQNCGSSVPNTQVAASQCGQTVADLSGYFYCDAVSGAQDYEWEFTNSGLGYSFTAIRGYNYANILKTSITGLQYGVPYNVRVRAKVAGVWGNYSSICSITVGSGVPNTQVDASQCGQTVADLSGYFYCVAISGAQDYEWEFTNSGLGYSFTRTRGYSYASIPKSMITGLQYGISYNVRVRTKVGGVWGSFGTTCIVTIGTGVPNTQVAASQCGQTVTDFSGYFNCNAISGAQDYEWEFTNAGLGYSVTATRGYNYANILKTSIAGLQYGVSYNVRVRAKVAGVWGSFGTTCTITVGTGIPNTQVDASQCGQTVADLSGYFYCIAVSGAQDYQWEFTNAGLGYSFTRARGYSYASIPKSMITGLQAGQTYSVRVRANVGGVWGNYSSVCAVTIGSSAISPLNEDLRQFTAKEIVSDIQDYKLNVYPNPSDNNGFDVSIDGLTKAENLTLSIFDIYGKLVYMEKFNAQSNGPVIRLNTNGSLSKGIYLVQIQIEEKLINQKVIIR
jgi:hypothetical protein